MTSKFSENPWPAVGLPFPATGQADKVSAVLTVKAPLRFDLSVRLNAGAKPSSTTGSQLTCFQTRRGETTNNAAGVGVLEASDTVE